MVAHASMAAQGTFRGLELSGDPRWKEDGMIEEREIASWRFKKGVLDPKVAHLCYLAANLAVGNTT